MTTNFNILAISRQKLENVKGAVRAYCIYKHLKRLGCKITFLDGWKPTFDFNTKNLRNWLKIFLFKRVNTKHSFIFLENVQTPNIIKLLRRVKLPVVVDVRDDYNLHAESMGIKYSQKLFCQRELANLESFEVAQKILLPSKGLVEYYSRRYKGEFDGKFVVVMNASDPDRFIEKSLPAELRIGLVGGANWGEGWDVFLKSVQLVKKEINDLSVHIAYNYIPETRSYIESLIKDYKKYKWIHFYDNIAYYSNAPEFYSSLYLVVIPRRKTLMNEMATPSKLFDAMASARPVVVTKCKEQSVIVEEENCGLLCDFTSEDMAKKIIQLLKERSFAEEMGHNGRLAVRRKHNWQIRVKKIISNVFCS